MTFPGIGVKIKNVWVATTQLHCRKSRKSKLTKLCQLYRESAAPWIIDQPLCLVGQTSKGKNTHTVDGSEIRRTHLGMYPKPLIKKMVDFNYQPQIGRNSSWSTGLSRIANKDRQICRLHRPRRPQLEPEELDLAAAVMKKTNPRFLDEDVGKVAYNS